MFDERVFFFALLKIGISYKGTKPLFPFLEIGAVTRVWRDSNPRHTVPETVALSPELQTLTSTKLSAKSSEYSLNKY